MQVSAGTEGLIQRARSAQRAAVAGDLTGLAQVLRELEVEKSAPAARAWSAALRSELGLTEPRYGFRGTASWFADFEAETVPVREGALIALGNAARRAVLDFDAEALQALAPCAEKLATGAGPEAQLSAQLVGSWSALARGDAAAAHENAGSLLRGAAKSAAPALVVETHAVRALSSIALGDHTEALSLARHASLVGRTEGLPQLEFFVHLALARARRYARQPHLALRILEALSQLATPPWRSWLSWEQQMAGGAPANLSAAPESGARRAAEGLARALDAARAGDANAFLAARKGVTAAVAGFAPLSREAEEVWAAIDPRLPPPSSELQAFREGTSVLAPAAIHGLRLRGSEDVESAAAYVLLEPQQQGVRLLHFGVPLFEAADRVRLKQSQRKEGRVETLLAILALEHEPGLPEADVFREAYGFEFVADIHRGVFDVLLHRVRAAVEGVARLERKDGRLSLHPEAKLLLPDPRVSQRTTDRLLRLLSERGRASAKDVAGALGVSLRTAQLALAELSESGACETTKEGRSVAYVVEDTVFSEPSRRLHISDLTGLTRSIVIT
jgi:hypothetical protein